MGLPSLSNISTFNLPRYKISREYALCGYIICLILHNPVAIAIYYNVGSGIDNYLDTRRPMLMYILVYLQMWIY
jgi:hypothetical protein